jgi:hypothetical protein
VEKWNKSQAYKHHRSSAADSADAGEALATLRADAARERFAARGGGLAGPRNAGA